VIAPAAADMIRILLAAPDDEAALAWLRSLDRLERSRLKTRLRSLRDLCQQAAPLVPTVVESTAPLQASLFELLTEADDCTVLPQTERLRRRFGEEANPQLVQHAALERELLTNERRGGFVAEEIDRLATSLSSRQQELDPFDWCEADIMSRVGARGRKTYYLHWQGGELVLRSDDALAAGRRLVALWQEWAELRQQHRAISYQRKQLARALGLQYRARLVAVVEGGMDEDKAVK